MLFSDRLPDKLHEYPHVSEFVSILDNLQNFKRGVISESLRVNNTGVLMDSVWLLKKLMEFGVDDLPTEYPIQILQQYLLNINTVCRTRGSKKGVELYCSLLSLGRVTVDDTSFYADPRFIFLDSSITGRIIDTSEEKPFYLADSSEVTPLTHLTITIESKYFNGEYHVEADLIKKYIEKTIQRNIGFSNADVTFNWLPCLDFYYHELLNTYFV